MSEVTSIKSTISGRKSLFLFTLRQRIFSIEKFAFSY